MNLIPLQPVMVSGRCWYAGGRICGQIVRGLVRWAVGDQVKVSLTSYAVIGAAAYMGGSTRMTLTSVVMVMETTGALQLIVPIMLTVFFAKASRKPFPIITPLPPSPPFPHGSSDPVPPLGKKEQSLSWCSAAH